MDPLRHDGAVDKGEVRGDSLEPPVRSLAIVASIIFFGNLAGRLLGLVREQLAARTFGAGDEIAAFTVADNLNTLIFDLISNGMLEAAMIPVLAALVVAGSEGREHLRRVTGALLVVSISIAAVISALGFVFAPAFVDLMTSLGSGEDSRSDRATALAVANLRIVAPSLVFLVAGTVMIAALYAIQRPGAPAMGSAARNLSIVVCILVLSSRSGVRSMAIGVTVGAVALAVLQWEGLRRAGLRPRFDRNTSYPELRTIARLYLPVFVGLLVSSVVVVVDRNLAWRAETDAIGAMRYATTLVQLILGLVVAAVSIAVLPQLSYLYAADDEAGFGAKLVHAMQLVTVLLVPAVVGMAILARPIVELIFERGKTGPDATSLIVAALLLYLPGHLLAGYDQVLIVSYYARKNTITPVAVGILASATYLAVAFALFDRYQMRGLVVANSVQLGFHTVVMFWLARHRIGRAGLVRLSSTVARTAVASGIMAVAAWSSWWVLDQVDRPAVAGAAVDVGIAIALGVLVYLGASRALGSTEIDAFWRIVRQRLVIPRR